jgi:hypothetical protein
MLCTFVNRNISFARAQGGYSPSSFQSTVLVEANVWNGALNPDVKMKDVADNLSFFKRLETLAIIVSRHLPRPHSF